MIGRRGRQGFFYLSRLKINGEYTNLDNDVRIDGQHNDEGQAWVGEEAVDGVQHCQDLSLLNTVQPVHYLDSTARNID